MDKDLEFLKKHYSENFAKLCRRLFPSILETEGLLPKIITENFAESNCLYDDIMADDGDGRAFRYYIMSKIPEDKLKPCPDYKSPFEIMRKAGYTLYKCETNKDIQSFKKYWKSDEELCTFRDPTRIDNFLVFFAVKNNSYKLKREDLVSPTRQDEYGTSVISIQFLKVEYSYISIKKRYNHAVKNPDATFSNNLDNIAQGLTFAFVNQFGIRIADELGNYILPYSVKSADGKFYHENINLHSDGSLSICPNNVVIQDGKCIQYDKSRYELIDNFLIDKHNKTIKTIGNEDDSFLADIKQFDRLEITKTKEGREFKIYTDLNKLVILEVNQKNEIIGYSNSHLKELGNQFMFRNSALSKLSMPNIEKIGNDFLTNNKKLKSISLPKVKSIGGSFLNYNLILEDANLPKCEYVGNNFMACNRGMDKLYLPQVKKIGNSFLFNDRTIKQLYLPKVEEIGHNCLIHNNTLQTVVFPHCKIIGDNFLNCSLRVNFVSLPQVKSIGKQFLYLNEDLQKLFLSQCEEVGDGFLNSNAGVTEISFPKLKKVGSAFISNNKLIKTAYFPNLEEVAEDFLFANRELTSISLPKANIIGDDFLYFNDKVTNISLPNAEVIGENFFAKNNSSLTNISLPKAKCIKGFFLNENKSVNEVSLPNVNNIGGCFMTYNKKISSVSLPKLE